MAVEFTLRSVALAAGLCASLGCGSGSDAASQHQLGDAAADAASQPSAADAAPPPSVADAAQPPSAADAAAPPSDAQPTDADWMPPSVVPPAPGASDAFWLSQTGLYTDIVAKTVAPDLIAFEPTYALWSDAADKQRWLRLPPGTKIDTTDMDHWLFPVGTMMWKEFALAGKRIETRLIMRVGAGPSDYFMGAFLWNDDESDARFVPDGQADARDTQHDLPNVKQCGTCHDGEAGRYLGFSAVQQPRAPSELLSAPPKRGFTVPGDEITARALGYLHANCGHCHNSHGSAWPDTDLVLRAFVSDDTPENTALYESTLGVAMTDAAFAPMRVVRGDPSQSGVFVRMASRQRKKQMPPFATEQVDDHGVAVIKAWIESL